MNRRFSTMFVVAACVALVWCPPTLAQEVEPTLLNVKWPGGTLAAYVEVLRKAQGEANIIITSPEVRDLMLPPVELKAVSLPVGACGTPSIRESAAGKADQQVARGLPEGRAPFPVSFSGAGEDHSWLCEPRILLAQSAHSGKQL